MVPEQLPVASIVYPDTSRVPTETLSTPAVPSAGEFDATGPFTSSVAPGSMSMPASAGELPTAQIEYGGMLAPGPPVARDATTWQVTATAGWIPTAA